MLALVMVPQATAKIWRRVNPDVAVDRVQPERHVIALMSSRIAETLGSASAVVKRLTRLPRSGAA